MEHLQPILIPDDPAKLISVYAQKNEPDNLDVYFGLALLEKVNKGKDSLQLKLLISRLYNMNYSRSELVKAFGFDRKTIKRWADALKEGDFDKIGRVLAGNSSRRKITVELDRFTRSRFRQIYPDNPYTYSSVIREEIKQCFGLTISSESLRPIFYEEKSHFIISTDTTERESTCDCLDVVSSELENNRKQIPSEATSPKITLSHHAGLYLLLNSIFAVTEGLEHARIVRQWLASVLLGAVNIEQSRRLNFPSLEKILGQELLTTLRHQRIALKSGATSENLRKLLQRNAILCEADKQQWFYYDPHSIEYHGLKKILKGWCGGVGKIARAHYQDFIHTAQGDPVFFKHYDNFYDLRERFSPTVSEFTQILPDPLKSLIFVVDRGIYGKEILTKIDSNGDKIITWEKGYQRDGWLNEAETGNFRLNRYRNHSHDLLCYDFSYQREKSSKIPHYERIIVRANGTGKENIEVAILTNDRDLSTEEVVKAMFTRWLQENDFQYQIKHFGLNQITSYDYEDYSDLEENLIDKEVSSNEYNALKIERGKLDRELSGLLGAREKLTDQGKVVKEIMLDRIIELKEKITTVEGEMSKTEQKCSKIQKLCASGAQKLKTAPKAYLDAVKITARNIFCTQIRKFRPHFNNFRNDHVILRALSRSSGFIIKNNSGKVTVKLNFAMTLQPKEINKIESYLSEHHSGIELIGSVEKLEKAGILLAIVS